MKKQEPSQLALVTPSMAPPPTKTEILEAMVQRAKTLHEQEKIERGLKINALKSELDKSIRAYFEENVSRLSMSWIIRDYGDELRLDMDSTEKVGKSHPLHSQIQKYHKLRSEHTYFDEKECRRELRDKLNKRAPQEQRIQELLANPEAIKAFDQLINE